MDAWFAYVLGLSELIFQQKLDTYEEACATLVLNAVGVHEAQSNAPTAKMETNTAEPVTAGGATSATSANSVAERQPEGAASEGEQESTAAVADTVGPLKGDSITSTDPGPSPSNQSTTSPASVNREKSESGADVAAAAAERRASPPAASPVETVGALLDAMQLRKPLRTVPSRSQLLDDIQAEADAVFQELEEVYTLRPDDLSAAQRPAAQSLPCSPPPSGAGRRSNSPSSHSQDHAFPTGLPTVGAMPVRCEHQLLYGELTSAGVRQLQAISMASVSVSRESMTHSRSQNFAFGASPPSLSPAAGGGGGSFGYAPSSHGGSSRYAAGGNTLLMAGNVPRGAVVMCLDVGSGNGRLLFEWARLGTAACRRKPESTRRRSHAEDAASPASQHSSHNHSLSSASASGGGGGGSYVAAMRRGNLLAATLAPLNVPNTNIVWRGWVGVGVEIVPSRMRVARRALVPHYLNFKPALLVPAALADGDDRRQECVPVLDPVAPEAIAVSNSSGSFSSPTSLTSAALARTAPASMMGTPTTAAAPLRSAAAVERVPQPTARVLLYEGDALAPGVLSNTTLCRFPHAIVPGDTLALLRGGAALKPSRTHDLVNGLGGEHMGSLGGVGYYTSAMSAPMGGGGAATCPYPTTSVAAAGAALNNAYLNSAAFGRKGPASFMESSICSVTSNASSTCSTRGGASAKHNYYRLCRVENGPSLTGREDPHLVVFCCGLGFDEAQVWKLCQRLEDILLNRPVPARTSPTGPPSMDGLASSHNLSEDDCGMRPFSATNNSEFTDAASPVAGNPSSVSSDDNGEVLEEMARGFAPQLTTPTVAEAVGNNASMPRDLSSTYRHWESVTCVLLLRPMDVLAPNFPLFRYATRIYNTLERPVAAEDTALLLATGNRTDGTAARYVMRDLPLSDSQQDANIASNISESDVWTTTLETTWMNAAPAWVVRFRF